MQGQIVARIRGRKLQAIRADHFAKHPLCVRCQGKTPPRVTVAIELDHVVPLFKGGLDVPSNRQGLCTDCHDEKTREDMGYAPAREPVGVDGWPVERAPRPVRHRGGGLR